MAELLRKLRGAVGGCAVLWSSVERRKVPYVLWGFGRLWRLQRL